MAKHIGIVACSYEGAALCYRTICLEAQARMGEDNHPEVTMHTHALARYMAGIQAGDWARVAGLMLDSARKVAAAGAEFAVCPDNTIHEAFDLVAPNSPIPWLHIAREVGREAAERGYRTIGILGTSYLMAGPVYPSALGPLGIGTIIPAERDRARIDDIIFRELVKGETPGRARAFFNRVIARLAERGADAVVLGCTEIPLLVRAEYTPLPTLDSTRLLARAAIREALA